MPRFPEFYPERSGSTVTLYLINPEDYEGVTIFRSEEGVNHTNLSEITTVDIGNFPYNDTIPDTSKRYKYVLAYSDVTFSVTITEDNSDETPPYYVATANTGVTFTNDTATFNPSWGSLVTYDTIIVDPLLAGQKSIHKFTA